MVLVGHGSREPYNKEIIEYFASMLKPHYDFVTAAFMQLNDPSIEESIQKALDAGVDRIIVLPVFLARGIHTDYDIPKKLGLDRGVRRKVIKTKDHDAFLLYGEPVGKDLRILDILFDRIASVKAQESMRVLVVDATHGGLTLSDEYVRRGYDVVCVDVHRTISGDVADSFKYAFRILKDIPELSGYDFIASPIHFPTRRIGNTKGIPVITHHQAVYNLLKDDLRFPVVEVTGSFGKTSTIWAAINILENQHYMLALTSDGIFHIHDDIKTPLIGKVSTTPANIIKAVKLCREKIDLAIFEVSLGGTGLANLGIIKNVYDNYPIAGGTLRAYDAKLSMVKYKRPNSSVLVNADDPLLTGLPGVQSFSSLGKDVEVNAENVNIGVDGIRFEAVFNNFRDLHGSLISGRYKVQANPNLVGRQHVENLLAASAIAIFAGAEEKDLKRLSSFKDVGNKMVLDDSHHPRTVLNISSSIGPLSLKRAVRDFLEIFPSPVSLCIGGKVKTSCGPIDLKELAYVMNTFQELNPVALFGEIGESIKPLLRNKEISNPASLNGDPILYVERR